MDKAEGETNPLASNSEEADEGAKKKRNQAQVIIEHLQNSECLFFHDQNQEAYMSVDGTGRKVIKLNSKDFELWLHHFIYKQLGGMVVGPNVIKQVMSTMAALAIFDGQVHELNVRITRNEQGLWYDLGRGGGAVHISEKGWEICENPPILFKSYSHQSPQVRPKKDGSIFKVFDYISNDNEQDKVLIIAFLVTAFFPDIVRPMLVLHGTQGSGKTTQLKMLKDLIDPSQINGTALPKKQEDLIQLVDHHAFIFFDNARYISQDSSDYLAQIITGISLNKRELYSNDADFFFKVRRPLAINSIAQIVDQPDLLQRSIIIPLKQISSDSRISDKELWEKFNEHKAEILGGICDILVKTLRTFKDIELPRLPRMADFAVYGYAAAEACDISGRDFLKAYSNNIADQNDAVLEAQPMAEALIHYLENNYLNDGTPSEWLNRINETANDLGIDTHQSSWPKNSSRFGKLLPTILPLLESRSFYKKDMPRGNSRNIVLYKKETKSPDDGDVVTADDPSTTSSMAKQLELITEIFGKYESLGDIPTPFDNDTTSGASADNG